MMEQILICFAVSIGLNMSMFLLAYIFQTDKITDISYSVSFILLSSYTILTSGDMSTSKLILYILINLWAFRLGLYLFRRIHKMEKDNRFDNIRNNIKSFFGFWFIQGISVPLILIPFILFSYNIAVPKTLIFNTGAVIAFVGFLIESIADYQKYIFKLNNPNNFMSKGLWSKLRHPNYTGEILFWTGLWIACISALNLNLSLIGFIGPVWIIILLLKFSGIPPLEKKWEEKYGNNTSFQSYYDKSWKLIPYIY